MDLYDGHMLDMMLKVWINCNKLSMHTPLQSLWLSFDTALHSGRESYGESGEQILPSDGEIQHGLENFLTNDQNRNAISTLSFHTFDGPLVIGTQQHDLKEIYQQFCTDEVKFRALWLCLVSLCNRILPESHRMGKQEDWLKGSQMQLQPAINSNPPVFDVAATFNAMPGNIGAPMQVLMEQLGQVNPAQLIGTLGTLVQPILAGIEDQSTKDSVAKIFDGITSLAAATKQ